MLLVGRAGRKREYGAIELVYFGRGGPQYIHYIVAFVDPKTKKVEKFLVFAWRQQKVDDSLILNISGYLSINLQNYNEGCLENQKADLSIIKQELKLKRFRNILPIREKIFCQFPDL